MWIMLSNAKKKKRYNSSSIKSQSKLTIASCRELPKDYIFDNLELVMIIKKIKIKRYKKGKILSSQRLRPLLLENLARRCFLISDLKPILTPINEIISFNLL